MRPLTIIRALHISAFAVGAWAVNMRWGDDLAVGKGPPGQWERQVVGAALLLFIAALAVFIGARGKSKRVVPVAQGIELLASLGALALTFSLRSDALDREMPHLLAGGGWLWMGAGAAMASGAALTLLSLRLLKIEEGAAPKATSQGGAKGKAQQSPKSDASNKNKSSASQASKRKKSSKKKRRR